MVSTAISIGGDVKHRFKWDRVGSEVDLPYVGSLGVSSAYGVRNVSNVSNVSEHHALRVNMVSMSITSK
jgi:hypothetical protein